MYHDMLYPDGLLVSCTFTSRSSERVYRTCIDNYTVDIDQGTKSSIRFAKPAAPRAPAPAAMCLTVVDSLPMGMMRVSYSII